MSGFGSGRCACCGCRIHVEDDICSSICEDELERRAIERDEETQHLMSMPEGHPSGVAA